MILAEAKKGLELVLLVEGPDRGAEESQEEPDKHHLSAVGTGLLDGYRGTL